MVTMHGFFDLKQADREAELAFKLAFDEFGDYLQKCHLITSYKAMRRSPNDNYDSRPPETTYYISMDFVDLAQTEACWDFIEEHDQTSARLHRNVFSKISDYSFFLSEDIPAAPYHLK